METLTKQTRDLIAKLEDLMAGEGELSEEDYKKIENMVEIHVSKLKEAREEAYSCVNMLIGWVVKNLGS